MKFVLKNKQNYNNNLLTFLMPGFIIDKLSFDIDDAHFAADAGEAVIMFVYICDFDKLVEGFKDDILILLHQIFNDFDNLRDKFGVQKIETVGNTYVAACGDQIGEETLNKNLR